MDDRFKIDVATLASVVGARTPDDSEILTEMVSGVALHTDDLNPGDVFFAFQGRTNDGHNWISKAFKRGASIVVAQCAPNDLPEERISRVLVVDDSHQAITMLSTWWRRQLRCRVIATCGESGTTGTKDALSTILTEVGARVYSSPVGFRTSLGAAVALLRCPRSAEYLITEVAVQAPHDGQMLAAILNPDYIVLTALHESIFGGMQNEDGARSHWIEYQDFIRSSNARAVLGFDVDSAFEKLLTADSVELSKCDMRDELDFRVDKLPENGFTLSCMFLGKRTILNTLSRDSACGIVLAGLTAIALGADQGTIKKATQDCIPTDSRFELWTSPAGVTVVRDQVSIEPISIRGALRSFKEYSGMMRMRSTSKLSRDDLAIIDCRTVPLAPDRYATIASIVLSERIKRVCLLGNDGDFATLSNSGDVSYVTSPKGARDWLKAAQWGDSIYISASPSNDLEDVTAAFLAALSATRLYVDLDALAFNYRAFQHIVGPDCRVMPMVKALCYGTDNLAAIHALQLAGADRLAVSSVDEGIKLRRCGVSSEILVLLPTSREISKLLQHNLTPVVYSIDFFTSIRRAADSFDRSLDIHLEVDTGMNRTGVSESEAETIMAEITHIPRIQLVGVMTHFAAADEPNKDEWATRRQLERFNSIRSTAHDFGYDDIIYHAANSAATLRLPEAHFDMVRIGIGLHGVNPVPDSEVKLKPVVSLVSRIVEIAEVKAGEYVGYGGTFVADHDMVVGVVAIGYHDGVPRRLSNTGSVVVLGTECPIVGVISMDSMMIDVTEIPGISQGVDVLIYGKWDGVRHPIEAVAELADTIPYELMTRVASRVQRIATVGGLRVRPLSS